MKRIAIFAHYDLKNKIEDYVVYSIKELKKVVDKIIFVSDSDVELAELSKIEKYIDNSIIGHHGEYDFGSYKKGYFYLLNNHLLDSCEELIFTNDSCYAPLYSYNEMFDKMSPQNVDFWGAVANSNKCTKYIDHIQSYFVVFKPQVFLSDVFKTFLLNVKKEESKDEIVFKYECGLTKILSENGYKWDVYSSLSKQYSDSYLYLFRQLIKQDRVPFLKRSIILLRAKLPFYSVRQLINKNTNYDYQLIKNDYEKNRCKMNCTLFFILLYKIFIRFPKIRILYLLKKRG